MPKFKWSPAQKKAARAAFDLALDKEIRAIRKEAEVILKSEDDDAIWRLHDYLSDKRHEIDYKYDYRYSVLPLLFARLVNEGWLTLEDLSGVGGEKLDYVREILSFAKESEQDGADEPDSGAGSRPRVSGTESTESHARPGKVMPVDSLKKAQPGRVKLRIRDVIEAMELPSEEWQSYVNPQTGEIVIVTEEERMLAELEEDPDDPEEQETCAKVREVLESDQFLLLPGKFEIHEWSIMERFGNSRSNVRQRDQILGSIRGRGAFRMFKKTIQQLGIEGEWYRFRDSAIEEIARQWLKKAESGSK